MKHVRITHTYIIPVPVSEDGPGLDTVVNEGVSIMENFMLARAPNIKELQSNWQIMPREYSRQFETPERVEAPSRHPILSQPIIEDPGDEANRVSFFDTPTVTHPWGQGLFIFPPDHPLHRMEERYRQAWQNTGDSKLMLEFSEEVLELEAAEEEDE